MGDAGHARQDGIPRPSPLAGSGHRGRRRRATIGLAMHLDERFDDLAASLGGFYRAWVIHLGLRARLLRDAARRRLGRADARRAGGRHRCRGRPGGPLVPGRLRRRSRRAGTASAPASTTRPRRSSSTSIARSTWAASSSTASRRASTRRTSSSISGPGPRWRRVRRATTARSSMLTRQDIAVFFEEALAAIPDLVTDLVRGIDVIDLHCGGGRWLVAVARRFPACRLVGRRVGAGLGRPGAPRRGRGRAEGPHPHRGRRGRPDLARGGLRPRLLPARPARAARSRAGARRGVARAPARRPAARPRLVPAARASTVSRRCTGSSSPASPSTSRSTADASARSRSTRRCSRRPACRSRSPSRCRRTPRCSSSSGPPEPLPLALTWRSADPAGVGGRLAAIGLVPLARRPAGGRRARRAAGVRRAPAPSASSRPSRRSDRLAGPTRRARRRRLPDPRLPARRGSSPSASPRSTSSGRPARSAGSWRGCPATSSSAPRAGCAAEPRIVLLEPATRGAARGDAGARRRGPGGALSRDRGAAPRRASTERLRGARRRRPTAGARPARTAAPRPRRAAVGPAPAARRAPGS